MTIKLDHIESYSYMLLDVLKDHVESNQDFYEENPDSLEGLEAAKATVFKAAELMPELYEALVCALDQFEQMEKMFREDEEFMQTLTTIRTLVLKVRAAVTDWQNVPFIDYLNEVDRLLEEMYGITTHDTCLDILAKCQEDGDTPQEFVGWIGEKYNLTPRIDWDGF